MGLMDTALVRAAKDKIHLERDIWQFHLQGMDVIGIAAALEALHRLVVTPERVTEILVELLQRKQATDDQLRPFAATTALARIEFWIAATNHSIQVHCADREVEETDKKTGKTMKVKKPGSPINASVIRALSDLQDQANQIRKLYDMEDHRPVEVRVTFERTEGLAGKKEWRVDDEPGDGAEGVPQT